MHWLFAHANFAPSPAEGTRTPPGLVNSCVEPPSDTSVVPAGAIAHFDNPRCLMRIIPEKSNLGPIGAGGAIGGGNIVAVQDLRV